MEEWRDIRGYEGIYQVSNLGRVKSLKFGKERILSLGKTTSGHMQATLLKNGVAKHIGIHQLVAEAFIPNPNGCDIVHHIDHDTSNNIVENLVWMTKEEHDAMHVDERKITVFQYTIDDKLVKIWSSASEAAKQLNFNVSHIVDCCNGKRKTHKGYKWSYEPL